MKITGQEQIAQCFDVAPKTIVEWQEQGMPIAVRGRPGVPSEYDLPACIEWYVGRAMAKAQIESPKDRLARLQADRLQIDIDEKLGKLIPADEIGPQWEAMVTSARSMLRAEPDRLAHLLEMAQGVDAKRDLLADSFDEFLRRLSADWERQADELERTAAEQSTDEGKDQ